MVDRLESLRLDTHDLIRRLPGQRSPALADPTGRSMFFKGVQSAHSKRCANNGKEVVTMPWDEGISGTHLQIAASDHPRIGVLAGPGTGKTALGLMRRVARLLEGGIPGGRILLLSFTR